MTRQTLFADVIVPLSVPNKYTYRVPAEMNEQVKRGQRVLVQFGKSRIYTAIIYRIHETAPIDYTAKYLEAVLDDEPVVTELQLKFWDWLGFYYCANPGEVMNAALPSGLKLSSTSVVQLNSEFNFEEISHDQFTEKEHLVLDALQTSETLSFEAIAGLLKIKSVHSLINGLLKKNAVVVYEDIKEKFKPKFQAYLRLHEKYAEEKELHEVLNQLEKKAFKQAEAMLNFLHHQKTGEITGGWVKKSELLKKSDNSALAALVKKSILLEHQFETSRLQFESGSAKSGELSEEQQAAYESVNHFFTEKKPVLLHGVTGSGKTEVYIKLIQDQIKAGKQVLMLVPEIALTTQLITRLRAVFGELVGVYHSRFSENERVEIWYNVLSQHQDKKQKKNDKQHYQVILGARSSLFLPYKNLGLVIIDEEHDSSFKQHDPAPRYHGRDAAVFLATLHKASVLLGSATPSIESYYNTEMDKYGLVKINEQYVKGGGTNVEVCDLQYFQTTQQMRASLTPPLFNAVQKAVNEKRQVILFQNRRGFAPYTQCKQCAHVPQCIQCSVSLIYHKQQQKLICHYCGYSVNPPKTCSACGSNYLQHKGMGTEKIEEDVELLFSDAKIARMDLDSTRSKYAYKQLIEDFEAGETQILIGTQMVSKGLDFKNVDVVGILNADALLNFPDFRSFEKAYQMLTQVRGRAGRNNSKGRVFIQTNQPAHKVIELVKRSDYLRFYQETLQERKQFFYPPYSRLFEINIIGKDPNETDHLANELLKLLKPYFNKNMLGPEAPLVPRIRNEYYKRILIKAGRKDPAVQVRETIYSAITDLHQQHKSWKYRINIDVDPV